MRLPHHLLKHRKTGVFYYRQNIPVFLRPAYGKTCVKISLHTKDPAEAKALSYTLSAQVRAEFERLKGGMSNKKGPSDGARRAIGLGPRVEVDIESIARLGTDGKTVLPDSAPRITPPHHIRPLEVTLPNGTKVRAENEDEERRLYDRLGIGPGALASAAVPAPVPLPVVVPSFIPPGITLSEAIKLYHQHRDTIRQDGGLNEMTEAERVHTLAEFRTWHQANASKLYGVPAPPTMPGTEPGIDWPVSHITLPAVSAYAEWLATGMKLSIKTRQKRGSNP